MMAAILILSVISQLILTITMAGQVATSKDQYDPDQLNYFLAHFLYQIDNDCQHTSVCEDEKEEYDYVKNKFLNLQNLATKLYDPTENHEEIMERIDSIVKQVENGSFNKSRQAKQRLGQNSLSNFTKSLKKQENSTEELAKLILEKYFNEFLEAIKYKNYQFAVIKFLSIKNETMARDFVKSIYKTLDNVDCLLKFTDYLNDMNKKLFIYRALFEAVSYKITSLIEICKLFKIRMKLYYNTVDKMPNELQTVANKLLRELDKRIEIWLTLFTVQLNQDLIVKIKYHSKLYGPVDYVHNITYPKIDRKQLNRLTSVLSCYPLQCKLNKI
uniref:Putative secreted protein n=1 Tax=Panstrongylus lignarius TaxID=156445 RepID=A0A224XFQ9_9HEMI